MGRGVLALALRSARLRLAVALAAAALMPACGDDVTDQDGGTLTDPGTATVLFTQSFPMAAAPDVQRPDIVSYDVPVATPGVVRVEVDWSSADHDIDVVVARTDCRSGIAAWNGDCQLIANDRSSLTKPARVDFLVNEAVTLRIYVYNYSNATEAAVLQVLYEAS